MRPVTFERAELASTLIVRIAVAAVKPIGPSRRETLFRRIDRLRAYTKRYWTPERFQQVLEDLDR